MTSIYDVAGGDFIRVFNKSDKLLMIDVVEACITHVRPNIHYKSWRVQTVDGTWHGMMEIRSYHLAKDVPLPQRVSAASPFAVLSPNDVRS